MKVPIGIILGVAKEEVEKDLYGLLENIAGIGYKGVEFGRMDKYKSSQVRKWMDLLNLETICYQTFLESLRDDFDRVLDDALELGCKYVVLNWTTYETLDIALEKATLYNRIGEKLKKHGLQFCYHNHAHEFFKLNGKYVLDILMGNTEPELLQIQFDTFWLKVAEIEPPTAYIKKYKDRCPLFHFQDKKPGYNIALPWQADGWMDYSPLLTEVGTGLVDFESIAPVAKECGAKWFSVEQWIPGSLPPLDSIRISYDNLNKMNLE